MVKFSRILGAIATLAGVATCSAAFVEDFEAGSDAFVDRWIESSASDYSTQEITLKTFGTNDTDHAMVFDKSAQKYGVMALFDQPIAGQADSPFVLQYEVTLGAGMECGGAYVKLVDAAAGVQPDALDNDTPYIVMFGPDRCGGTNKVHFIVRHQNPVSKKWEEKHLKNPPAMKDDKLPHLYTLIVQPDNSFSIRIDEEEVTSGTLLSAFEPAFNPPKTIPDPADEKPDDWVDAATIPDPDASKPDDWDETAPRMIEDAAATMPASWLENEPEQVPDPAAEQPQDWDEEEDGEWEAPIVPNPKCEDAAGCGPWKRPMIPNPDYKGKWTAPLIPNPDYKGEWKPQEIDNPNWFEDKTPALLPKMSGLAIEIWTMSADIRFDNFYVGHDVDTAAALAAKGWRVKFEEKQAQDAEIARRDTEKRRLALWEEGGFSGRLEYVAETLGDFLSEHPFVGIGMALTLAVAFMALLWRCCLSDDDEGFETDPLPMEASEEAEAEAEAEGVADKPTEEGTPTGDEGASGEEEADTVDEPVPAAQKPKSTRQRARRTET